MTTREFHKDLLFEVLSMAIEFTDEETGLKVQHIETIDTYMKRSDTWSTTYFRVGDKFYSFNYITNYDNGTTLETEIAGTYKVTCQEVKRVTKEVVKIVNEWQNV